MDIIAELTRRIEARAQETATPCKMYGTRANAEKAAAKWAMDGAKHFAKNPHAEVKPARFIIMQVQVCGVQTWVVCFDLTELMRRDSSTGGYLGFFTGFFTY